MSFARSSAVFVLCTAIALAQTEAEWVRAPAISPDGRTIAFSALGDLWLVPTEGGVAVPLTLSPARDTNPVWSPDGQWIAFASDRHGQDDVFLVGKDGGEVQRLTFESTDDQPTAFAPDGRGVIFRSARGPLADSLRFPSARQGETWIAPIPAGPARRLLDTPSAAAVMQAATGRVLYEDQPSIEDEWRKHHRSSAARDIWLWDPETRSHTPWTTFRGEDREPVFDPKGEGIYWLSAEAGTLNVHHRTSPAAAPTQITRFATHPVRALTVAEDGTLCMGWHGEVWIKSPEAEPARVGIRLRTDFGWRTPKPEVHTGGAEGFAISPDGKEVAFAVRGEIFVAAVKGGETRRITQTAAEERDPTFSPDGRELVYATERAGGFDLWRARLVRADDTHFHRAKEIVEEPLVQNASDAFQPRFSPVRREVLFLEDRTTLKLIDLETREERVIRAAAESFSYADGDQSFEWSPDGEWILTEFLPRGFYVTEIGLLKRDGSSPPINLSRSGFADNRPRWAKGAPVLTWFTTKDGMQDVADTGGREVDVHALFLTRAAFDRYRKPKAELEWIEAAEKEAASKAKPEASKDEKSETPKIEIELEGLADRRARLSLHSARMSDALLVDEGKKLVYLARFEGGFDLWVTDVRSRETKILAKLDGGGGVLLPAKDGGQVWLASGGGLSSIELASGKREGVEFRAERLHDGPAERRAVFDHVRRTVRAKFYEPTLHGKAWTELCDAYEPKLAHIANEADFAELLSELLGELDASHTGARFRSPRPDADATASIGLLFDEAFDGAGLRIAAVLERGPLDRAAPKVLAGHVLEAVDGQRLDTAGRPDLAVLLNRKAGQRVLLSFFDPESRLRYEAQIQAISRGEHQELLYRRWVQRQRALTEKLSGGRIGYVHVRNMSDDSYRTVFDEVLGRHVHAEALIVDTRFNGGGDLVDDLSRFLIGRPYMDFKAQDGRVIGGEPMRQWTKPSLCLMSEGNYSDAHCFPFAFKELGIGKLVGMPVAGTCTFVWWEGTQIPGLTYGIPNLGVRDLRGNYLENLELQPDLLVRPNPQFLSNGRDEQLEAGVIELLKQLDAKK